MSGARSSAPGDPHEDLAPRPQRVLVVGSGYVGEELSRRLLEVGHEVWALRRRPREPRGQERPIAADVTTGAGLEQLPSTIETFVYCVSPGERSDEAYRRVYVEGLQRILERLPRARPLLVSSTALYGGNEGEVDHSTRPIPAQDTAQRLLEAEAVALGAPGAVVLRASGIYGPGRTKLLARLARAQLSPAERGHLTHRVHRDDLARALQFFIERPALHGAFIATDREPATLGALQEWLSAQPLPRELLSAPSREPRAGRSSTERRLSSDELQRLGFHFLYPSFREGYGAILRELREREEPPVS